MKIRNFEYSTENFDMEKAKKAKNEVEKYGDELKLDEINYTIAMKDDNAVLVALLDNQTYTDDQIYSLEQEIPDEIAGYEVFYDVGSAGVFSAAPKKRCCKTGKIKEGKPCGDGHGHDHGDGHSGGSCGSGC